MRLFIALAFNNFDVGLRIDANLYAQVVIGLITLGVMIWIVRNYSRHDKKW